MSTDNYRDLPLRSLSSKRKAGESDSRVSASRGATPALPPVCHVLFSEPKHSLTSTYTPTPGAPPPSAVTGPTMRRRRLLLVAFVGCWVVGIIHFGASLLDPEQGGGPGSSRAGRKGRTGTGEDWDGSQRAKDSEFLGKQRPAQTYPMLKLVGGKLVQVQVSKEDQVNMNFWL